MTYRDFAFWLKGTLESIYIKDLFENQSGELIKEELEKIKKHLYEVIEQDRIRNIFGSSLEDSDIDEKSIF